MLKKILLTTILIASMQLTAICPVIFEQQRNAEVGPPTKDTINPDETDAERTKKIKKALRSINDISDSSRFAYGAATATALLLASKGVEHLLTSHPTDKDDNNAKDIKETKDSIDKTISFLERIKTMLIKMNEIVCHADVLIIKVTCVIERLAFLRDLCF